MTANTIPIAIRPQSQAVSAAVTRSAIFIVARLAPDAGSHGASSW